MLCCVAINPVQFFADSFKVHRHLRTTADPALSIAHDQAVHSKRCRDKEGRVACRCLQEASPVPTSAPAAVRTLLCRRCARKAFQHAVAYFWFLYVVTSRCSTVLALLNDVCTVQRYSSGVMGWLWVRERGAGGQGGEGCDRAGWGMGGLWVGGGQGILLFWKGLGQWAGSGPLSGDPELLAESGSRDSRTITICFARGVNCQGSQPQRVTQPSITLHLSK